MNSILGVAVTRAFEYWMKGTPSVETVERPPGKGEQLGDEGPSEDDEVST
jgi:hypothetical protein